MLLKFTTLPWLHRLLILFFLALIIIALFFLPEENSLRNNENNFEVGQVYPVNLDIEHDDGEYDFSHPVVLNWEKHVVRDGESMALMFQRLHLPSRLLHNIINTNDDIKTQLSNLRPRDSLIFGFDENNQLVKIKRILDPITAFHINRNDAGFTSKWVNKEVNYQYNYAAERITSNFWNAGTAAGLTANQMLELANIFGWDIDFALDIRVNDHFHVLYQEKIVEGEKIGRGKIVAAVFHNQGEEFTAILDEKTGQYYDKNGQAMKKTFLRSPIDFRRVTSNFNPNRRHPVTGQLTAHRGTDYAAPVGTPIWAAGDGIVEKSGFNQFNGNYVFIRHSSTYMTKYLHMNKRMVKTSQRVKQGDTIGTLGGTGRVTGPHLHYEFLVNGVHQNPRTVSLPQSKSLSGSAKERFCELAKKRLDKLLKYKELKVADVALPSKKEDS